MVMKVAFLRGVEESHRNTPLPLCESSNPHDGLHLRGSNHSSTVHEHNLSPGCWQATPILQITQSMPEKHADSLSIEYSYIQEFDISQP